LLRSRNRLCYVSFGKIHFWWTEITILTGRHFIKLEKMKKYIFSAITILIIGSCKDALLEKPKSLTVEEFFNTPQEVESGLAAIYSPIRASIGQYWNCMLESQTEWGGGLTGAANADAARAMQGLDGVTANNVEGVWNNFFVAIRNANLVIA